MQRFVAKIIYYVICGFSLLPLRVHYCISDIIRFFLQYIIRYRRKLILKHLRMCFPNMSEAECLKTLGEFYEYLCDIFVETVWQFTKSDKRLFRNVTGWEGGVLLDEIYKKNKKVLILMGHIGNWERMCTLCGPNEKRPNDYFTRRVPFYVAYKALEKGVANEVSKMLRSRLYRIFGASGGIVESNNILRHILERRNEEGMYIMIADQSPLPGKRIVADLFGNPTLMMAGPEYLASKLNIPTVYLAIRRVKRGVYDLRFSLIAERPAEHPEFYVTRQYAKELEYDIKEFPAGWLWSHKRWKRPLSQKEWEEYAKITSPEHAAMCHTPEYDNSNLEIDTLE